jgi:CheY-like chemotaxis protein
MRVRATERGLTLRAEHAGPLPKTVYTDPTRVRQILMNLVSNAIKFTAQGEVRLTTRCLTPSADAPPHLEFTVRDAGIGLSPEQIGRLFQPFTQADSSTTRQYGGTGLGLTISKRLARLLGGDITVESAPGQGSTFQLTIATGTPGPDEPADASYTPDRADRETDAAQLTLTARILLAEDGPDNQRLISFLLRKAGAEVTIAANGREAVDTALGAREAGTPFDIILMDIQMPIMDGHEATRTLRRAGYEGVIIALTAHAMLGDRAKCTQAGCDWVLTKPIERARLLRTIGRFTRSDATPT